MLFLLTLFSMKNVLICNKVDYLVFQLASKSPVVHRRFFFFRLHSCVVHTHVGTVCTVKYYKKAQDAFEFLGNVRIIWDYIMQYQFRGLQENGHYRWHKWHFCDARIICTKKCKVLRERIKKTPLHCSSSNPIPPSLPGIV